MTDPTTTEAPPSALPLRRALLIAGSTSLAVFVGYLPTVAREVPPGDTGELVAAARCLGIPHPPGYPAWCLYTHAFSRLVPGVSFTFGANLSSAAAGALAAGTSGLVAAALGCGAPGVLGAGLLAGLAKGVWTESTAAEVYPLNALFFAGMVLACLARSSRKAAASFGLLAGLSLTMHPVMRGLVPIAAAHFALARLGSKGEGGRLAAAGVGLLAGLLVLLYLPIRAAADPPVNFENPRDLRGLVRLLGMIVYRSPEENVMVREPILLGLSPRLRVLGATLWEQWPFPVLGLAGVGAVAAFRRRPLGGLGLAAHALAATIGIAVFSAGKDSRLYPPSYATYSLPAFVVLAVFSGIGLDECARALRRVGGATPSLARSAFPLALVSALLLGGWTYASHLHRNDRSEDALPCDLGRNVLETVEPGGILLAWGDRELIPSIYAQVVLGVRPDVEIGTRGGRVDRALLRRYGAATEGEETETLRLARAAAHLRPIYTNWFDRFPEEAGLACVPVGILHRIVRRGTDEGERAKARNAQAWLGYRWRTLGRERRTEEHRAIEAFVRDRAAEDRHAAGDLEGAVREWRELAALRPFDAAVFANVGTGLANLGRPEEGLPFLGRAVRLSPGDDIARISLGGALVRTGRHAEATAVLEPFSLDPPSDIDGYLFLAQAARATGDRARAERALEAAREGFPSDPRAFAQSALYHVEELRDPAGALIFAERALGMKPDDPDLRLLLARIRAANR